MRLSASAGSRFALPILTASLLAGCDPVVNIAGANFPSWLFCAICGTILTVVIRPIFVATRAREIPVAAAHRLFQPRDPHGLHRVANLLQSNLMSTAMPRETGTTGASLTLRFAGHLLSAAIVIVTIVVGLYVARLYYLYPRTDDAYVRANFVGIAPHVSGPITELPIVDNQYVKQGDLLFIVDPRPYQAALDSAIAKLQLTELNIKALTDAIRTAKSDQVEARRRRGI